MPSTLGASPPLTELLEPMRRRALDRFQALRPHLEDNLPLTQVAKEASVPFRTAQRWVSRYRRFGLAGLARTGRADRGKHRRLPTELCHLAEGLALQRPPLGPGAIYREVCRVLAQVERLLGINRLQAVTAAVVEAAWEGLVIGTA